MRTVVLDGYPFRYYRWSNGRYNRFRPKYRDVRLHLIAQYGVCYHCQKPVKDYPYVEGKPQLHDDLATIDHLKPRPNSKNPIGRRRHEAVQKVLCCYRCNHNRNVEYQRDKN